jgi:Cu-Zn family superoxide dismutase
MRPHIRSSIAALAGSLAASLAACMGGADSGDSGDAASQADTTAAARPALRVTATVRDAAGRELGVLTLTDTTGGIAIAGALRGLPPGEHGFHLHTTGACTPDFEAAGGHWNPTMREHGRDNPSGPHLGDLSNITVGADSAVTVAAMTPGGTLRGEEPLLDGDGAAVVVHAGADDYRSDPAGEAGDRVACGAVSGA